MGACDLCPKCDIEHCPKRTKDTSGDTEYIWIPRSVSRKLDRFCRDKGFTKGEEYYRVSDHSTAVSFLLNEHLKRCRKNG